MPIDYSKWDNLEVSSSDDDTSHQYQGDEPKNKKPLHMGHVLGDTMSNPKSYLNLMSRDKVEEWIFDVYRMRCDDDIVWGGCNYHGIYELSFRTEDQLKQLTGFLKKKTVISDLIKFSILAVETDTLPEDFNFSKFLEIGKKLLKYTFCKDSAKEKYGGENVFSLTPSLRRQGEHIYKVSVTEQNGTEETNEKLNLLDKRIDKALSQESIELADGEIFKNIGGKKIWVDFFNKVKLEV